MRVGVAGGPQKKQCAFIMLATSSLCFYRAARTRGCRLDEKRALPVEKWALESVSPCSTALSSLCEYERYDVVFT